MFQVVNLCAHGLERVAAGWDRLSSGGDKGGGLAAAAAIGAVLAALAVALPRVELGKR